MGQAMAKRFEYDRMSADDFNDELARLGWEVKTFARIFGVNYRTAERMSTGEQDVPIWAYVAFALVSRLDSGVVTARDAAAEIIRTDSQRPELGEYPFMGGNSND